MSSLVISSDKGGCHGGGLRIVVLIFASFHTLFRGVELLLDLISTFAMIAPLVAGNSIAFKHYLSAVSKRVLWKGPYPHNFTEVIDNPELNLTDSDIDSAIHLRVNLHLWSSHLLMRCFIFIFAWILIFSAKKKNYSGTLAWLTFSTPLFLQSLLHLTLDLCFWDYTSRPLQNQIVQGIDIAFQPILLVLVACLLYQLRIKNNEIRRIDRYTEQNGFPRATGNITIRQIVDDDQRF